MRKSLVALSVFAMAIGGSTACATKGFVKNQVGQVSTKVDTLSQSLEETQERTKAERRQDQRRRHQGRRGPGGGGPGAAVGQHG